MKTVGIIANPTKKGVQDAVAVVQAWSLDHRMSVIADDRIRSILPSDVRCVDVDELVEASDLMFAFGGDGTLLSAARRVAAAGRETPIIGVNMGSLGFLTQIPEHEFPETIKRLDPKRLPVSERMMISVAVAGARDLRLALNDVVVAKGAASRMLSFAARVDGEPVTRYAADGLVLSTPTGSTAHSLSAGGPVVMPNVEAIIATPICPHTLSIRPLVVPPTAKIELEMISCDDRTVVTTDGHRVFNARPGDRIIVEKAEAKSRLVQLTGHSYYEILRQKMRWTGRVRER